MKYRVMAASAALCFCAATPMLAQSLSRIQILALQQELRDKGCGVTHATGRMDAPTRRAVEKCKGQYNVTGGAAELLVAMNIGFGPNDSRASVETARSGVSTTGAGGSVGTPVPSPTIPMTPVPK